MSDIAGLRKARGYVKAKLTRLKTQVVEASDEAGVMFDKEQAETRLEKLEEIQREFEAIQRQLIDGNGDLSSDDTMKDERFEENYFEVKTLLKRIIRQPSKEGAAESAGAIMQLLQQQSELIQQIRHGSQGESSAAMTSNTGNEAIAAILSRQTEILDRVTNAVGANNTDTRVKLPTIKLPRFDGKIEDWKCFSDSFRSIIHDKPHLSNIEKFQYLISSISGDAAKIIESIELTQQNYTIAWELLQQRYDDSRSLKKKHIQCLFMMPTKKSAKALRDLIDYTSRHLRVLKVLSSPTETWANLKPSLATSINPDLPVLDRIKEVRRLKLCINCLKNDHYAKTCRLGHCRECEEKHNTLCRVSPVSKSTTKSDVSESKNETGNEQSSNMAVYTSNIRGRRVLMATAIVEATQRNGSSIPIRVLRDSASEANFITQAAHNKLGLKRNRASEVVTGLNEIESKISGICDIYIKSKYSNFEINAQCLIVPKITKNLPSMKIDCSKLQIPGNINLADSEFNKISQIDMLIGAEFFFDLLESGKIELGKNQLILQNTKFRWTVAGSMPVTALANLTCNQEALSSLTCSLRSCEVLNENLERFWKLENYGDINERVLSVNEKKCERHFEQNTTRGGRFIVKLPFHDENLPIGNNREIAYKRWNHLERNLMGNAVISERYLNFMREYIELGHMSVVDEPNHNYKNIVYLPHHGVLKESSSSTKLRVVFDASAKNNQGVFLNDALLNGPVLQDNLIDIILRFRFHKVALTADLQKMYRQVLIHPTDRDFQRVLWRFDLDEPIKEYRLNTVTYGQTCASYLAVRCLRQLAIEGKNRYPLASHALLNDTYVDDIISGANTVERARILQIS